MRTWTALSCGAAGLLAAAAFAPEAEAQSFLQKIFGFGGPSASEQVKPSRNAQPVRRRALERRRFEPWTARRARQKQTPRSIEQLLDRSQDAEIAPPDSQGPYRTVCVRMCDGFYFPVRYNARHKDFADDAKTCESACGAETRLFYYPTAGAQSARTLIDLQGGAYSDLPNAFLYRKRLVDGCTCKPAPWSAEAEVRHKSYADSSSLTQPSRQAYRSARAVADGDAVMTAKSGEVADAAAKPAEKPQPVAQPRSERPAAARRTERNLRQRAAYRPEDRGEAQQQGFSIFGKNPYVWPGDRPR